MKGSSAGWSAGGEENIAKPRIANTGGKGTRRRVHAEGVAAGQHPILGDLCTRLFIVIERKRQRLDCGHWPSACLLNMAHIRHDPVVRGPPCDNNYMSESFDLTSPIYILVCDSATCIGVLPFRYLRVPPLASANALAWRRFLVTVVKLRIWAHLHDTL